MASAMRVVKLRFDSIAWPLNRLSFILRHLWREHFSEVNISLARH